MIRSHDRPDKLVGSHVGRGQFLPLAGTTAITMMATANRMMILHRTGMEGGREGGRERGREEASVSEGEGCKRCV